MSKEFCHLHLHTEYSLLDSSAKIKKLIARAKELGMKNIAITDHGVMYGCVAFYKEAVANGIKPILGCEVYVAAKSMNIKVADKENSTNHLVLLVKNEVGYENLMKIVSAASIDGFYYKPRVDHEYLKSHSEGIIALSACLGGEVQRAIMADDYEKAKKIALEYKDIFKDVLFPLGEIEKPEVRKIAREYGLVTASKKDSTGICFIGERNFTQFLENYLPNIPGDIVNIDTGEILGKHIGLMYYTIGQRRGLNIGGTKDRTFVVKKDLDKNILYVAVGDDNKYLYSSTAIIEEFNYLTDKRPSKCTCKFRYRQSDIDINVKYLDNNNLLLSYKGSKAVTPGQFCVLYDKDICLGGGIIKEVK